ncbi:unnamed protein product [Dovyalis caffra]|uniref:Histidine-containing phosphotransfer protein n=1 Tax=Dovyalis caffra TaxID=77055 RepID=A0AAV1R5Y9_9ROSI|nr:unnamed protein product [Dovyalis caffra]
MEWTQLHRDMLDDLVHTMHHEKFINDDFYQVQAKKATRPDYVVQAITNYCIVSQSLLNEMTRQIIHTEISFLRINIAAHDMYAKNRSIGAERVKNACMRLIGACHEKNRKGCYSALVVTKNEFSELRKKFSTMVKLERKILENELADM